MTEPAFRFSRVSGSPVDDDELIADLRRVAEFIESPKITQDKYSKLGTYDCSTLVRRFGSWNKALLAANLSLSNRVNITDEQLFENLLRLWQHYGRQPRRKELNFAPSTISQSPYSRRFNSWTLALKTFTEYANSVGVESSKSTPTLNSQTCRRAGRAPSLRLRWQVLQRDRFTCCSCGASPAVTLGVELHVNHKIPWSKGGETMLENLQTLCSSCNLGKSDE